MRFFYRNVHIYVFAMVSILLSAWVANNPQKTVHLVRPLVEDAVELKQLAKGAYQEVARLSWHEVTDEAVTLFVTTMRMPTMLFERLADSLDKVDKDIERRQRAGANTSQSDLLAKKVSQPAGRFVHPARADTVTRLPAV